MESASNDKCGHACSGCKLPTPSEHGYVVLRIVSRRALLQIYRMGCLRRLVLELNGRFDRAAMRGLLDRAAGGGAVGGGGGIRAADIHPQALANPAAGLRRARTHNIIPRPRLPAHHTGTVPPLGSEGVV